MEKRIRLIEVQKAVWELKNQQTFQAIVVGLMYVVIRILDSFTVTRAAVVYACFWAGWQASRFTIGGGLHHFLTPVFVLLFIMAARTVHMVLQAYSSPDPYAREAGSVFFRPLWSKRHYNRLCLLMVGFGAFLPLVLPLSVFDRPGPWSRQAWSDLVEDKRAEVEDYGNEIGSMEAEYEVLRREDEAIHARMVSTRNRRTGFVPAYADTDPDVWLKDRTLSYASALAVAKASKAQSLARLRRLESQGCVWPEDRR